jgi:hypothetical protein
MQPMPIVRTMLLASIFAFAVPVASAQDGNLMHYAAHEAAQNLPTESGQSAFAAIHEVVEMLEADPDTDWSKVNIDALRRHLIDMDNMTLYAKITYEPITNGEHIRVSGGGEVRDSIQRMVMMHVAMAGDTKDWHMNAARTPDGADINVIATSPLGLKKLKALGLMGMMAEGMHHARHHMMLARGSM